MCNGIPLTGWQHERIEKPEMVTWVYQKQKFYSVRLLEQSTEYFIDLFALCLSGHARHCRFHHLP